MWEPCRRRRQSLPESVDINLINLVDVALVLLIIFMITAPMLQGGVEVQLPKASSAPITATEGLIVTVSRDGNIYLGDLPVRSLADFEEIFPQYVRGKGTRNAYLKGDRDVPYGRVLQVLGLMKKLDVTEVGLVADPEVEAP
ncbi:MAG: biopolymer transporter ExbD [Gemmatimonadetes bacterium]|nr:biopolymer transporter ExbD [Gemmatimonadota bacterium]